MGRRTYAVAALAALAAALAVAYAPGGLAASTPPTIPWSKLPDMQTGPPPWNAGVRGLTSRLRLLGLSRLSQEGSVLHIHQHLDLYVNAQKIRLPAFIGIDIGARYITELHTHDSTGVIHVESPTQRAFTLGQVFGEWGVKLTASCVGRYCGHLRWWVDGHRVSGDPAELILRAHQEIAIAAGPPPLIVPKSYAFPPGD
ncbi:MAG TPA: hypothetical protein VMU58_02435 [Gaiellaceae bacterium]|nr:hypothetical protein [Gaiellaceae bacterium]